MSVIGEFTVQSAVMRDAREHVPEMVFEVVEIHLHEGEPVNTLLWAQNGNFDELEVRMDDDRTVAEYDTVADLGDRRLYYISLTEEGRRAMSYPFSEPYDMVVLEATVRHTTAEVRALFTDRDSLEEYRLFCQDREIPFTLQRTFAEVPPEESIDQER